MNGVDFPVAKVLDGIAGAREAGLAPIKVNMVVRRGINEDSVLPMARWARDEGLILRFIEYMDVGHSNGWRLDEVVPAAEIVARIDAELPLEPADPGYRGEVANRWRYPRRQRRGRRHRLGHRALLRRLHARATVGRGPALHLPVRGRRPRPPRSCCGTGRSDAEIEAFLGASLGPARRPLLRPPNRGDPDLPKVEMFAMGG